MRLVLLLTLVALAVALSASAQSVNWVQYINPTNRHDTALGVCLFGDYVAVVGSANSGEFVALLDRASGGIIEMSELRIFGAFYNCLSVGDKLYAVGNNEIYIFDKKLNALRMIIANERPYAIVFDGSFLYVASYIWSNNVDRVWRIEKRTLSLDLVAYREFYREWDKAYRYQSDAYDIAINPVTGELWVVGKWNIIHKTNIMDFRDYSLLVIFDKGLNVKRIVEYPRDHENYLGDLYSICFDERGNAYVVGQYGVAKFNKYGDILAVSKRMGGVKIACVGGRVYVFGDRLVGNYERHVLYVLDEDLNLLGEYILSKGVEANSRFWIGKPAFDGKDLYVAGYDLALGENNSRIIVYSISLPWPIRVVDELGRPMQGVFVKAVVGSRSLVNWTGEDGVAWFSGVVPEKIYVYDWGNLLVGYADGNESRVVVRRVGEVQAANSVEARGYAVFKGQFLNGTAKSLVYEVAVSGGTMRIQRPIPSIYPVEVYVDEVSVGALRLKLEKPLLVYRGNANDLAKGLDFAELGLTSLVSITAVDSTGSPKRDWAVQLIYGNITVAESRGTLTAVLPRTDALGRPYTVRVITNAITPEGRALVKEQALEVTQKALAVQIPVSLVRVVVQAVDGFGNVRQDWPVVIENVASGMGQVSAEVVEGQRYVARATGLGFTNTTAFTAKGPQMVVAIKIPTAKITAQAKDGFGKVRSDWPVEIVGVAAGQGTVGPVEVLAGQYTVKTSVFGKDFTQTVTLQAGQSQTVTVQVPTAMLSVTAVDDDKKPIDRYVTAVQISGPVSQSFSTSPKNLEVLAGQYTVTVSALNKQASTQVTLQPGQTANVEVVVPGTAGLDFLGTRIPLPTLVLYALLLLVIVVILAIIIIEYNNWRRRRLMQILAPPK